MRGGQTTEERQREEVAACIQHLYGYAGREQQVEALSLAALVLAALVLAATFRPAEVVVLV